MWRVSEKLSGEDKVTKRAVELFYGKIDYLIEKRLEAMRNGYKPNPDAGVDLLDLFMQSTTDKYTLGGMVYSFLSAGRTSILCNHLPLLTTNAGDTTTYNTSWFMMEIHHKRNQHLNALSKIRAEIEDLGFTSGFLSYTDAPVSWESRLNTPMC